MGDSDRDRRPKNCPRWVSKTSGTLAPGSTAPDLGYAAPAPTDTVSFGSIHQHVPSVLPGVLQGHRIQEAELKSHMFIPLCLCLKKKKNQNWWLTQSGATVDVENMTDI